MSRKTDSFRTVRFRPLSIAGAMLLSAFSVHATAGEPHAAVIAPYCDDQTVLVAHVDTGRIDIDKAARWLLGAVPLPQPDKRITAAQAAAKVWLAGLRKAGGRDLYVAFSLTDLGTRRAPVFLVVPVAPGGDADALAKSFPTGSGKASPWPLQTVRRIPRDGPLVFGPQVIVDRLQKLRTDRDTADRKIATKLAAAFAAVEEAPVRIVLLPTDDQRRVLRDMFPRLPKPLDAIDGATLADGIIWKAVGVQLPPRPAIRVVVQAGNPVAARRLAEGWKQLLAFAAGRPVVRKHVPMIDRIVRLMQPTVKGDRLVVSVASESIDPIVRQLLLPAITAARSSAHRTRRMNQFKQIALAMHNWADARGATVPGKRRVPAFPPAAIYGKDGTPLLSWRVALLPYLGQRALYEQFRLNEPWDSPHNRKLLGKMPDVFRDTEIGFPPGGKPLPPGYTTYVVPIGKGLVFGRNVPTRFLEISDGTSNTILLVEVVPERAVPWTKPADWNVPAVTRDPKTHRITKGDPLRGLRRSDRKFFTVAICDGSLRVISNQIDPSTFYNLLTRAGGDIVDF